MPPINYWAVLVCAVLSMVLGFVWYGPLFGKKWMTIIGATAMDEQSRREMQRKAGPLYLAQFLLTLFQLWVLAWYVAGDPSRSGVEHALWIWAAFVMPTVAAGSMWNNDTGSVKRARFFIQSGYYLALFLLFGLILGMWR